MKKNKIFRGLIIVLIIQSCTKTSPGDNYNFTNSLPPYVTLGSLAAKTVSQGSSTTFTFQMRTALQQDVTVTYSVTGAVNIPNQAVVIPRDKTISVATVMIPGNIISTPGGIAAATLTLNKAVTANGMNLTIGQNNDASKQKVSITITQ